jgi:hypothetical protein
VQDGTLSKRKDSLHRSGRSPDWLKMKNADALAVKQEQRGWEAHGKIGLGDW